MSETAVALAPPRRKPRWRKYFASPRATVGFVVFALFLGAATFAPWIAPQDPYDLATISIFDSRLEPGTVGDGGLYILGTDDQGRDMLSAILYGLRISLTVGLLATFVATVIGVVVGLIAAYVGGWVETVLMRLVDFMLGFPAILVALVLLAVLGQGVDKVIIAIIAVQWAQYARILRSSALSEQRREYIEAARNFGFSPWRIMALHLLPNCLGPVLVVATIQVASAISIEATLSFLGLGVPITEPSLGLLIANGFDYLLSGQYWISFYPGFALLALIASINLIGDRARELLNPRLAV